MSTINTWSDDLIGQAVTVRGYGDGFLLRKTLSGHAIAYIIKQGKFTTVPLADCTPVGKVRVNNLMHPTMRVVETLSVAVDDMLQSLGGTLLGDAEGYHDFYPDQRRASLRVLLDYMVEVCIKCGGALEEIQTLVRLAESEIE